jgi:RHS repeat-associated protein
MNKKRYADIQGTMFVAETNHTYDAVNRLTNITHSKGATTIASYAQSYDAVSKITYITSTDGNSTFNYDDTDQLTGADYNYQTDENYTYDANGNRTNTGYVTGINNRLLEDNKYRYEYDKVGNRTKRTDKSTNEVTEYSWDIRDRLTGIRVINALSEVIRTANYVYDVYNQRIAKIVDLDGDGLGAASTERFVYGSNLNIALVFDGNGTLTHRYMFSNGIDQIEADEQLTAGTTLWALTDHLGSVRDVVDNSGTVQNHIVYDAFGNITSQTNSSVIFRNSYTGQEFDSESGLYNYGGRPYDPFNGKFIQEDKIGFAGGDANLNRYVGNNSINLTDPTGYRPVREYEDYIINELYLLADKVENVRAINQKQGDPKDFARDVRRIADDLYRYIDTAKNSYADDPVRIKAALYALDTALFEPEKYSGQVKIPNYNLKVREFNGTPIKILTTCNRFVGDAFAIGVDRKYDFDGYNGTYPTVRPTLFDRGNPFADPYPVDTYKLANPDESIPRLPVIGYIAGKNKPLISIGSTIEPQKLGDIISFDESTSIRNTDAHTGILLNYGIYVSARNGYTFTRNDQFDGAQISRFPYDSPITIRRFKP